MGQQDILNYNVDVKEKQIVAARNAAIDLGEGKIALVQSFQGSYSHQVNPVYESGSSAVYFVNGNPTGTFSYNTLVGANGWFSGIIDGKGGYCGSLRTINIDLLQDNPDCDVKVTMNTNLKFEGAMLRSLGFSVQAGGLSISTSGDFICSKLIRS